jgi:16S rRNA (cytidine1402-2'-O)-methyltransferase
MADCLVFHRIRRFVEDWPFPMPLYVVATPIGNLEDLSFRALRVLREVDLIAAEDTRRTSKLLAHYEIRRPLISLREHNEVRETPRLLARLERGESIALVSDAGTPGISDPGARLVRSARERKLTVVPVPGPSAVAAALSGAGFAADRFVFLGFPPRGGEDRKEWLAQLAEETRTVVFFEAPHRIRKTLADLAPNLGDRQIVVARELTKTHEEWVDSPIRSGDISEIGEFTVVLAPAGEPMLDRQDVEASLVASIFGRITNLAGFDETMATKLTAVAASVKPSAVRRIIKKHRISVKRQNRSAS